MEGNNLNSIQEKYQKMLHEERWIPTYFEFEKLLLKSNSKEYLELHYEYLKNKEKEALYHYVRDAFGKRSDKEMVSAFLISKYKQEIDLITRGDIIQILGNLKSKDVEQIINNEIHSPDTDIRYRCIIVLGWIGQSATLSILNERMLNDAIGQLRGYAATAMRQIWYNHPKTREKITEHIRKAIGNEIDNDALTGMIITIQDMYNKKLGLKESVYGDVSGDVLKAKEKTIKYISTI